MRTAVLAREKFHIAHTAVHTYTIVLRIPSNRLSFDTKVAMEDYTDTESESGFYSQTSESEIESEYEILQVHLDNGNNLDNENNEENENDDDPVCKTVKEFMELYYNYMDNERNMISNLYMDNAILNWNNNRIQSTIFGKDNIHQFWLRMLPTEHTVSIFGADSIDPHIMVKMSGQVKFKEFEIPEYPQDNKLIITQTLIIMMMDDEWKIIQDSYGVSINN